MSMGRKTYPKYAKPGVQGWLPSPWAVTRAMVRGADWVLTAMVALFLSLTLLYTGYAMWDTWRIYDGAGVDASLLKYKPGFQEDGPGFTELLAINSDMRAWLTLEGTNIDYPVVQGQDNIKYVNTDVYGEFSLSGCIFLDSRNAGDFSDAYSLLYGHHMAGNLMFGELMHFTEEAYFAEHETAILHTPDHGYLVELFATLQTDAYDLQVFSPGGLSQEEMTSFLARIQDDACQYRQIGVTSRDRILAMSTCSDASSNGRTIVFGRLTEITT